MTTGWKLLFLILSVVISKCYGQCGQVPEILNGSPASTPSSSADGTQLQYTCDVGFEFASTGQQQHTITCSGSDWSAITDCTKVNCPVLPADAVPAGSENTYGTVVTMSCTPDKRIPGVPVGQTLEVTCQANKKWDKYDPAVNQDGCVDIACPYPLDDNTQADPAYGLTNAPPNKSGSFTFQCKLGHNFRDGSVSNNFYCDEDGKWKDKATNEKDWSCDPLACPQLNVTYNLTNVKITPATSTVGVKVKLACVEGFQFNDSSIEKFTECQANETWSFKPFDCQPLVCAPVKEISNAYISTYDNWYPTVVNYTCVEGFSFADRSKWRTSQCNKFGKWTVDVPSCSNSSFDLPDAVTIQPQEGKKAADYVTGVWIVFGILILGVIIVDILTFPRQIAYVKKNIYSRFNCGKELEDDEESELASLDGEEIMKQSVISLGRGRITPAPSAVDLQSSEKLKNSIIETPSGLKAATVVSSVTETGAKKTTVPRTRLASARTTIQKALSRMPNATKLLQHLTVKPKNQFGSSSLPLGADNYGKTTEFRVPSPTVLTPEEEDEESSEYESTDDETPDA